MSFYYWIESMPEKETVFSVGDNMESLIQEYIVVHSSHVVHLPI